MNFSIYFKIFLKSLFSTIAIGYLLYSFIYINNNDFCSKDNILDTSCYNYNPHAEGKSIIWDQPTVLSSYMKWLKGASYLDFGQFSRNNPKKVFNVAMNSFMTSMKLIVISIFMGLVFCLLIHFISTFSKIKTYISDPILSLSFLHIITYAIIFKNSISIGKANLASDIIVCSIIAIATGMLYDFYTLIKNEHDNIIKKDYVVFAYNSGFNQYIFAAKELIISLIFIIISRIPLLFAGMTILEILSNGKYNGVGYIIWYYVNKSSPNNYSVFFGATIITVFFFTFLYFVSEKLKEGLSPKVQKT